MMDAAQIRIRMKEIRRALDAQEQKAAADAVFAHIIKLDAYRNARCVMAYMACRGELSLERVIADVLRSGRVLALPRCEAPGLMTARRVIAHGQLRRGAYGLPEPDESCEIVDPAQIDLVLAPGTAFDRNGNRIGQGGGYYDRFLPATRAKAVGICHDFALLECLPHKPHDYRMGMIVTPSGAIGCQKKSETQEDHR